MRNLLLITLGIIIIASLIFLLGYLLGRGYGLKSQPIKRIEKKVDLPYTVQVASFQSQEKAKALANGLVARGYPAYIEEAEIKGKKWYRVRVSSFRNKEDAQKLVDRLREKEGLKDAMVWKRQSQ